MTKKSTLTQYNEFLLVLKTHLAEYLKKPLLNLGFIFSLAIATSTLLSILVLNHASQQQYQQANSRLTSPITAHIVAKAGQTITIADYSRLRTLGFYQLSPTYVFTKTLKNGNKITFQAIDILPWVLTKPASYTSNAVNIGKEYANSLQLNAVKKITLKENISLNVNINAAEDWGAVALLDLTLAWQLFTDIKGFSHLMISAMSDAEMSRLEAELPPYLSIQPVWSFEERQGFADALHLNLSALAILGFIVSLFISYQAANQAWSKRAELAAQLRLLGIELDTIQKVMLSEALLLTLLASLLGIVIAIALVSVLLPILGLTLEQVYSLRISGHFQWRWQYSLWALVISALAVLVALIRQFRSIGTAQIALSARPVNTPFNFTLSLLIAVILLFAFFIWPTNNWYQLMFKYGLLLMASVAWLANFLRLLLQALPLLTHSFTLKFVFKDASQQVGRRYLPIAAFYLALTSSIAGALMVNSFQTSFVGYLNQLLNSDMLISYSKAQKPKLENWLQQQDEVEQYVLLQKTLAKYGTDTVKVYSLESDLQQVSSLLKEGYLASSKSEHNTCYINEPFAIKRSLSLQQLIVIQQGKHFMSCQVVGIYYDYGSQKFAIKIPVKQAIKNLSGWQEFGFAVFYKDHVSISKQQIIDQLAFDDTQVFEPAQIRKLALEVFAQTFLLTQAIAFVLLMIACFGLFLSANSLELARKADLHILSSLGYSRVQLFCHMLLQWLLLACGTILLSWPIAIILAKALVSLVLPASFGWSMPLVLDLTPFAVNSLIALLVLIPALGMPLYKLNTRANL